VKRLLPFVLVSMGLAVSACAVGEPKPPTYVSDVSAMLNANVYSNVVGQTAYFFRYGETTGYGQTTPEQFVETGNDSAHPVSEPIAGLDANTLYHWQVCVRDSGDPTRDICSKDQTFTTATTGGRSGIAFASTRPLDGNWDIHVMGADGSNPTNLTNSLVLEDRTPAWSPDGKRIVFVRQGDLWTMNADGSNQLPVAATPTVTESDPAWSPDGARIAFSAPEGGADTEIVLINPDGSGRLALTNNSAADGHPAWSPEGQRIVFDSTRDGGNELFLMSRAGSGQVRISDLDTNGESEAVWARTAQTCAPTAGGACELANVFQQPSAARSISGGTADQPSFFALASDGSFHYGSPTLNPYADHTVNSAVPTGGGAGEIYKTEFIDPTNPTNLTNNTAQDLEPAWSPRP
jgi:dipeptidyl aminopeptidase/acylaminoacyl peptidase